MKEWLVVREISSANVLSRHWEKPKHRFCVLQGSILSLSTSDTPTTSPVGEYSLSMATVKVHHYSKEKHTLVLSCHPVDTSDISTEVTLHFQNKEQALQWLKAIRSAISEASELQQKHAEKALDALSEFVKERMFLRSRQVGEAEVIEKQIEDLSKNSPHRVSNDGEKKLIFDSNMNLDCKVWKAFNYDARFREEVYQKYGSLDDEKKDVDEENSRKVREAVKGGTEDDDYDFVNINDEKDDTLPLQNRANSLTSYFGSVATALYNNAASQASLASSLTKSSISAYGSRSRDQSNKNIPFLSSSTPSVFHNSQSSFKNEKDVSGQSSPKSISAPHFVGHSSVTLSHMYQLPIPKLRILILAVGTRGDVQPLALLGKKFLADGHRVRLATHSCYRDFVESYGGGGLEFYPLGGDPVKLSEFMVKTHGSILPSSPDVLKLMPENLLMLNEIINSCWGACVDVDPGLVDKDGRTVGRKFQADAIISNPVTYAHIHCAEALGVPLHLFFPQPWVPTKAFPHPLACMNYDKNNQWSTENYLSYQVVERMMWMSLEPFINNFRVSKLNLPPIRRGEHGWNLLNTHKVPFVKMWSKHLVPVPKDWGAHVEVVGFFLEKREISDGLNERKYDAGNNDSDEERSDSLTSNLVTGSASTSSAPPSLLPATLSSYQPDEALRNFLESGSPPVFVGFGSMVVDDAASLIQVLLDGAALLGVRILVQSGWSEISDESFQIMTAAAADKAKTLFNRKGSKDMSRNKPSNINGDALLIGALPHDWLFPYVRAVIHHGGAGTTAAGLCAGKPTMICPFFGDQHFWGHMVFQAGVGPEPCSIHELTPDKVASGLNVLLSDDTNRNAKDLAEKMNAEDGVKLSMDSFYQHIHLENMICDVSIFLGESRVAQLWCRQCGFKMNKEVSDTIHNSSSKKNKEILGSNDYSQHDIEPCVFVNWADRREPVSTTDGLLQGVGGATHEVVGGISDAILEPINAIYQGDGILGAVDGMVHGLQGLVIRPITGGFLLYNKVSKGIKESLNSRGKDIESKRQSLPDPQRRFSRPGGLIRQGDSVYGAGPLLGMPPITSADDISLPMSEKKENIDSSQTTDSMDNNKTCEGGEDGREKNIRTGEINSANVSLSTPRSVEVESDVQALDQVMHRALQSSAGAFVTDLPPDTIQDQMTNLFHSFAPSGGGSVMDYDYDSGLSSGLASPSPTMSSSVVLTESQNFWGGENLPNSRNSNGMEEKINEISDTEIIFSPLADYSSEEEAEVQEKVTNEEERSEKNFPKSESVNNVNEDLKIDPTISRNMDEIEASKPSLLFNSTILSHQLHLLNCTKSSDKQEQKNNNKECTGSFCKDNREIDILKGFLLAQKVQCMLEDVIGSTSRFITFEDFATMLSQAMGKNLNCPPEDLRAVTLNLAQVEISCVPKQLIATISERKEFLDFVDFSLLLLSMQDEIKWKNLPQRVVGKK